MTKESEKEKTTTSATERPTLLKFCISSIAAGVCIGIAGLIYSRMVGTELGKFVGALSFSAGLYYVVLKGLTLYTGRIGFLSETVARFAIMLVMNFVGAGLAGAIAISAYDPDAIVKIAETKLALPYVEIFWRAFLCGMAMYFAVDGWKRTKSPFPVCLGVFVFVACGFEHCIADVFYFSAASQIFTLQAWKFTFFAVLGNTVGAIFLQKVTG
ncbi:MAG: formate/nitrite transporter family protein [Thermoguttaceae bacterium]|nr:formate/nitrite transporter family protein [Thermoguttaceae bacterium]